MDKIEKMYADRADKFRHQLLLAVHGGLQEDIEHEGGILLGISIKVGEDDILCTLRAEFPVGRQIAFVGGEDIASVLVKAARGARVGSLRWKTDEYVGKT